MTIQSLRTRTGSTRRISQNLSTTNPEKPDEGIWDATKNTLKDISASCKARSVPWPEIGRMADVIVSHITAMETRLGELAREAVAEGRSDQPNFPYLSEQLARQLDIHRLVGGLKFEVDLAKLDCVHGALTGEARVCREGTREKVLAEIELWAGDFSRPPIYWLNGTSGTGKSTVARTIVERMSKDGKLGASFFCSRNFQDRHDPFSIAPTLAVQLAHKYPGFRSALMIRKSYPSLKQQINGLVVQPLAESAVSTVIILDGLSECEGGELILSILGRLVSKVPNVKFFIASRPESGIQTRFELLGESSAHASVLDADVDL